MAEQGKAFTEVGNDLPFRAVPTAPLSEPIQRALDLALADAVTVGGKEALIPEHEVTASTVECVQ